MDWSVTAAILAAVAAVAAPMLTYRSAMKATRVNARAVDINEQAAQLQWVKELRAEAADAKNEVKELRAEVTDLRRQLAVTTREAEQVIAEMQLLRRVAWRDGMSLERFREFIGSPPPSGINGRS